jgi:hypothetical protein
MLDASITTGTTTNTAAATAAHDQPARPETPRQTVTISPLAGPFVAASFVAGVVHEPDRFGIERSEHSGVERVSLEVDAELGDEERFGGNIGVRRVLEVRVDEDALAVGGEPFEELLGLFGV